MIYQILVEVPSDLDVLDVDGAGDYIIGNDVVGELAYRKAEWPNTSCPDGGHMMPGTRVHQNKKLIHAMIQTDAEDPLGELTLLIAGYALDWTIMGMATLYAQPQRDEDGNPIPIPGTDPQEYEPDVLEYLMPFDSKTIDYIADVVTDASDPDNPVFGRPTPPVQLHRWARPGMTIE